MGQELPSSVHPALRPAMDWFNRLPIMTRSILHGSFAARAAAGDKIAEAGARTWDLCDRAETVTESEFFALAWMISHAMYMNKEQLDAEYQKLNKKETK